MAEIEAAMRSMEALAKPSGRSKSAPGKAKPPRRKAKPDVNGKPQGPSTSRPTSGSNKTCENSRPRQTERSSPPALGHVPRRPGGGCVPAVLSPAQVIGIPESDLPDLALAGDKRGSGGYRNPLDAVCCLGAVEAGSRFQILKRRYAWADCARGDVRRLHCDVHLSGQCEDRRRSVQHIRRCILFYDSESARSCWPTRRSS